MLSYVYYRSYCFYEKKGLAINPHTYALGIPTFIEGLVIYFIYYLLVSFNWLPLVNLNGLIFAVFLLCLYYLNGRWFSNKIPSYKKRWKNEKYEFKRLKGVFVSVIAIGSFVGMLMIANAFFKLSN